MIRFARLSGSSCKLSSGLQKENQRVMYWHLSIFLQHFQDAQSSGRIKARSGFIQIQKRRIHKNLIPNACALSLSSRNTPHKHPSNNRVLTPEERAKRRQKTYMNYVNNSCRQQQKNTTLFLFLFLFFFSSAAAAAAA